MILRVSESLTRAIVVFAAIVFAAALSFYSLRMAWAAYAAGLETADGFRRAVDLEPYNSDYWYRFGYLQQFNLDPGESSHPDLYFLRAVALNSLNANAWLDLGTYYELDRHIKAAREAFLRAKLSYPSSAEVSWRYGNFLLRDGDLPTAYAEIRRAVQSEPHRAASAFSRCYRANPDIDTILNQALPVEPSVYVDVLGEVVRSKQIAVAQIVWKRLLLLHPHLHFQDFDPFVSQLSAAGQSADARRVWDEGVSTMTLPALQQAKDSVVWDPSFESGAAGYSFSWRYQPVIQGVQILLDPKQKHSGSQSLRLTFDGRHNQNLEPACTVVNVESNTAYHFSGWVRTQDLTTNSGIGFRIHSVGGPAPSINQTPEIHDTTPWTSLEMGWTAGPQVHQASICIMREPSDTPNMNISGTAWVDDINLVPESEEPRKP